MTRKHFIQMAQNIRELESIESRWAVADAFIKLAKAANPRFDESKFLEACGI